MSDFRNIALLLLMGGQKKTYLSGMPECWFQVRNFFFFMNYKCIHLSCESSSCKKVLGDLSVLWHKQQNWTVVLLFQHHYSLQFLSCSFTVKQECPHSGVIVFLYPLHKHQNWCVVCFKQNVSTLFANGILILPFQWEGHTPGSGLNASHSC